MNSKQKLLNKIESYLIVAGMTATKFGKTVMNDTDFVFRLRRGGDITLGNADKVQVFIEENDNDIQHHPEENGEAA